MFIYYRCIIKIHYIMPTISDYISQLQTLTQRNIDLLTALNESFFTKREHIQVQLGTTQYVIPSFISLENKINAIQENFENLVNAPKTGETVFHIDGNSKRIEVKGYTNTPSVVSIDPTSISNFEAENNDVFKDFMTPTPYLKVDLSGIPNDISMVDVKKIAFTSDELKDMIKVLIPSSSAIASVSWQDLYKTLSIYKEDTDYALYDTIRRLPTRDNIGYGLYTIKSIDKDIIDSDLYEYITMTLHEELKYTLNDGVIDSYIKVGDQLVTYDDSSKMEITSINTTTHQITVKVINGDYLNLSEDPNNNSSNTMSRLKFFSSPDYDSTKYINVPLEEDEYIAIFISPIDSHTNVRAPWGSGVLINTYNLTDSSGVGFKDYYDENVRNIGDILNEMSLASSTMVTQFSQDDFNKFINYKPIINIDNLEVVQINSHINNSTTIKTIRSLYSQKQSYNNKLAQVKEKIANITSQLSTVSFNDTTGVRSQYEDQLMLMNKRYENLLNAIIKASNEIATAANDSVVPIENAKYRIRGYFDWASISDSVIKDYNKNIKGIRVQYRYKNQDLSLGTAVTIGNDGFIFSDWNNMAGFDLMKNPSYENGKYKFGYKQYNNSQDTSKQNEPSFNQIDIPISQGETVDIRLKIVWDFGYPFIETTSDWSPLVNIAFPDEFLKDVQITDIIDENNKDIEDSRFTTLLQSTGVTTHVGDSITDQDITYFHQPNHIASGFYTSERRIIPLGDKLSDMVSSIQTLQDIIQNTNNTSLSVSLVLNSVSYPLSQGQVNDILLQAYKTVQPDGSAAAQAIASIQITNNSAHDAYIYSVFPSSSTSTITLTSQSPYNSIINKSTDSTDASPIYYSPYAASDSRGVWIKSVQDTSTSSGWNLQRTNQWITFRVASQYDGSQFYQDTNTSLKLSWLTPSDASTTNSSMVIYPYIQNNDSLIIDNPSISSYLVLACGESVVVPLYITYFVGGDSTEEIRYISFDIRPSLYRDPVTYTIRFTAKLEDDSRDVILRANIGDIIRDTSLRDLGLTTSTDITKYSTITKI